MTGRCCTKRGIPLKGTGQPPLDGWPYFVDSYDDVISQGGRVESSPCVLAEAGKSKIWLPGWGRTWATKRSASHAFDRGDALPRGRDDWVPAAGNPLRNQCTTLMQHVQTSQHGSDGRKSRGKQSKHRQQFPHEIHLQRDHRCQEYPHPFPALVFGLDLHALTYPLPHSTLTQNPCSTPSTQLDARTLFKGSGWFSIPVPFDTIPVPSAMVQETHFWS
jgi:hypothetical protein